MPVSAPIIDNGDPIVDNEDPIIVTAPERLMGAMDAPNPTLLAPVLPAGSVMLLRGPRGIGLSHVVAGCAAALATGGSFLGWRAPRPVRVLYLAGNLPTAALAGRLAAALAGDRRDAKLPETLRIVTRDGCCGYLPDLSRDGGHAALERERRDIDALLIDDLAAYVCDDDDIGSRMAVLGALLASIAAEGAGVVVAQHSVPRAGSRIDRLALREAEGVADVVLGLKRPADYHVSQGARFELHIERAAHLAGAARVARLLQLVPQADGSSRWVEELAEDVRKQTMLGLLDDGVEVRAAGRELGVSQATAYRWRKEWLARNDAAGATGVRT